MKPVDVKPSTYIDFSKEINYQLPKFKIGDFVRISKYNFFFAKQLCSKLVWRSFCVWNNLKTLFRGYMLLVILKEKKFLERFTEKNCKKQIRKRLALKTVIKKKDDNLYVKWKCYGVLFSNWIDKKDSVNEWIFFQNQNL